MISNPRVRATTLVEAIVAASIFLGTMVLLVSFAVKGRQTIHYGELRVKAVSFARATLERLIAQDRAGTLPPAGGYEDPPDPDESQDPFWAPGTTAARRTFQIGEPALPADSRRIVVRVRWKETGREMTEELGTLRVRTLSTKL